MEQKITRINYHGTNFKCAIKSIDYVRPHSHREIEVWLVLHGQLRINIEKQKYVIKRGEFCIINQYIIHEVESVSWDEIPIILLLYVQPDFFAGYFPMFDNLQYEFNIYGQHNVEDQKYREMLKTYLSLGITYYKKEPYYQLHVAELINRFYAQNLDVMEYRIVTEEEKQSNLLKMYRLKKITDYINAHYAEKIMLTDMADLEGISSSRLSHLFKEYFGCSFQEYLQTVRCEKAKDMLQNTDLSLLDISISCGFSDPKYFNQGFKKIYGSTPKEYRKKKHYTLQRKIEGEKDIVVKSGSFFTDEDCYMILEYCESRFFEENMI